MLVLVSSKIVWFGVVVIERLLIIFSTISYFLCDVISQNNEWIDWFIRFDSIHLIHSIIGVEENNLKFSATCLSTVAKRNAEGPYFHCVSLRTYSEQLFTCRRTFFTYLCCNQPTNTCSIMRVFMLQSKGKNVNMCVYLLAIWLLQ